MVRVRSRSPPGSCRRRFSRPFRSVDRKLRASGNHGRERDGWRAGGLFGEVEALLGEEPLIDRNVQREIQHRLERLRQRNLFVFSERRRGEQDGDKRGGAGDTRKQRHSTSPYVRYWIQTCT